jgi:hypothetical protein
MCRKIRCDEESGNFCKNFWELNKTLDKLLADTFLLKSLFLVFRKDLESLLKLL